MKMNLNECLKQNERWLNFKLAAIYDYCECIRIYVNINKHKKRAFSFLFTKLHLGIVQN